MLTLALGREKMKVKVAAVQMRVVKETGNNLERMLHFIDKAGRRKCDFVCFPENSLVSTLDGIISLENHLIAIRERCRKNSIWCIFSTYEKEKGKIWNIAYVIDKKGKIRYRYKKVNLWKSEAEYVSRGLKNKVVDTEFGKIGVIICYDYLFPEFVNKLGKSGAKIIFCPSYMVDYKRGINIVRNTPLIRAFENKSYFVHCDAFTRKTASISMICDPYRVLRKIERKEGLIVATLDLGKIDRIRDYFKFNA